jgi:hypothetical protein
MKPNTETMQEPIATAPAKACLTAGCPCKDARIVSRRRAGFFAALARSRGETADRIVAPERGWRIPLPSADAAASI